MRKSILKKLSLVFFLLFIFTYIVCIENIPDELIVFQGEKVNLKTLIGIKINNTIETSSANGSAVNTKQVGNSKLNISLFNNITLKNISVNVLPKTTVIPVGNIAGVKLYTNGVLVVGMSEIQGDDNKKYKPYENTGIQEGDLIVSINKKQINSTKELIENVNQSHGKEINIQYIHNEEAKECSIHPVKINKSEYKLGLWVRDSAAGVGTVTFYNPSTKSFAALGHGITDIDTNELINIASGEFVTTRVLNITKGENGTPGKIQGTVENQKNIGRIYKNSKFGIYGIVDNVSNLNIDASKEMEVALREEIREGKATILCCLDGGKAQEYEIEIEKTYKENNYDNKSMKIKVVDEKLINKTGGIIQGMSGSPVIQNNKFIGAVTHVLVQNPKEGYAVFAEMMIKEMKKVE